MVQQSKALCVFHGRDYGSVPHTIVFICFLQRSIKGKTVKCSLFITVIPSLYVQYCADQMLLNYTCNNTEIKLHLRAACLLVQLHF